MSEHIKKICIFDFDGTLCASPENTMENRALWEEKTGRKWPHKGQGWWSKDETLDPKVFDIKLHPPVLEEALKAIDDNTVYTVLLTGRMPKFSSKIKEICRLNGLGYFDAYFFNDSNNTLDFKLKKIHDLKEEFPHVKNMIMWEDREEHITHFNDWGALHYKEGFIMNVVKI